MVVLLLALLVGPVAGAHPRLDEQLVALARISGECLAHGTKRHEPQAGHHLAGGTLFVLARIVVAHQAEARVTAVTLGHQFRVTRQIAHRGQRDRKSTRLNSSHSQISYAVFCLKKKKKIYYRYRCDKKKKSTRK